MLITKSQSICHSTLTKVKFIKATTKIIEISIKSLKIELLKILSPTAVSIPIDPVTMRPNFAKT